MKKESNKKNEIVLETDVTKKDVQRLYYLHQKKSDTLILIVFIIFYLISVFQILQQELLLGLASAVLMYFILKSLIILYGKLFSFLIVSLLGKRAKQFYGHTITKITPLGIKMNNDQYNLDLKWEDIKKMSIFKRDFLLTTNNQILIGFNIKDFETVDDYNTCLEKVKNYLSK